jgi:hypothetical protein
MPRRKKAMRTRTHFALGLRGVGIILLIVLMGAVVYAQITPKNELICVNSSANTAAPANTLAGKMAAGSQPEVGIACGPGGGGGGGTINGNETITGNLTVNNTVTAGTGFDLGGTPFLFGSASNGNVLLGFAGNATMTTGSNTAVGMQALFSNTTGYNNIAMGYRTLYFNTASWNTAVGWGAMYANTTGYNNTATGSSALTQNTTGVNNLADGGWALYSNIAGSSNTASGYEALFSNTAGGGNVASGYQALYSNTTAMFNTALGFQAGPDSNSTNLTNATAIGAYSTVSESNALVLGGSGSYAVQVGIGTATPTNVFTIAQGAGLAIADGWSTYSSRRWKSNIQTLHGALAWIIHQVSSQKRKDALKGMMNTGFPDPAFPFGASIA